MTINIKVRDNGPYLVEGEFTMTDAQGNPIEVKKPALCRCGGSTMKPFCDGTHSKIGFQAAERAVPESKEG
jgi:3-phenylpropionate/trans-cinnamate dioxygenase ferredoxin subunit